MVASRRNGAVPRASSDASRDECAHWGIEGLALGLALAGPTRLDQWRRQQRFVQHAEALGLHSVWLPEMHFAAGATPSPLLALAALAAQTRRLRLGTSSLLLPVHPPELIAQTATTLDHLSNGRLILGLGRGFRPALFRAFGIDPKSKRDRFDHALDHILDSWTEDGVGPPPAQRPHPPLAVAAFGPKGLLQAARRGLPYLASPMEPFAALEENRAIYRDNVPSSAWPRRPVVPIMRTVHVAKNDAETTHIRAGLEAEAARLRAGAGRLPKSLARAAAAPIEERTIVGVESAVLDQLSLHREKLGMNLLIARPQIEGIGSKEIGDSLERLADICQSPHFALRSPT